MDEFRRDHELTDGPYQVVLWTGEEWIDLAVETPSGRKIPCRYTYASKILESRLATPGSAYLVPPGWIMIDRVPEALSPKVIDVAQRTIDEFMRMSH